MLFFLGENLTYAAPTAIIVTSVCLGILILWRRLHESEGFYKDFSGSLTAVLAGIAIHLATKNGGSPLTLSQLVNVPTDTLPME